LSSYCLLNTNIDVDANIDVEVFIDGDVCVIYSTGILKFSMQNAYVMAHKIKNLSVAVYSLLLLNNTFQKKRTYSLVDE
jgi:hypothetical protein